MTQRSISKELRATKPLALGRVLLPVCQFVYVLLAVCGQIQFSLWPQVEYIHLSNWEDFDSSILAHIPRYLVVWPVFFLSELLAIDQDYLFSIYVVVVVVLISISISDHCKVIFGRIGWMQRLLLFISFAFLSLFMNGRIVFALLGFSWLLRGTTALVRQGFGPQKNIFLMIGGLFLCTVSSGTFAVAFLYTLLWSISILRMHKRHLSTGSAVPIVFFVILLIPVAYMYAVRNMEFYGGGLESLWGMLSHGMGLIANPGQLAQFCRDESLYSSTCVAAMTLDADAGLQILIVAVFLLMLAGFISFFRAYVKDGELRRAMMVSLFGGLFGFSTLALMVVPGAVSLANRPYHYRKRRHKLI